MPVLHQLDGLIPQCLGLNPGVLSEPELLEVGVGPLGVGEGGGGVPGVHGSAGLELAGW